ncbi:pleckstrin domain-containing protein [Heterostelium album PN500]|uniref:Pleckstrin domain-containing protein n=1 Tax=Heterostelium pallidum (strain ATCC 26659 / Pp 5 / PN500) TaxID=670386 RepID=D3B411_HETP5|nr:pleckstrin domain-containing protein [Heterostelium album PN500]EFA84059.1 pleckstrin domain-containing protein [Heterostelium album PN500]|eukprot:XP_020436176.1 pleckstrin domain-containing protein [Heterostelium album PN500]
MGPKKKNNKKGGQQQQQQQQKDTSNKSNSNNNNNKVEKSDNEETSASTSSISVSCDLSESVDMSSDISSSVVELSGNTDLDQSVDSLDGADQHIDSQSNSTPSTSSPTTIITENNNNNNNNNSNSNPNIEIVDVEKVQSGNNNDNVVLNEISKLYSLLSLVSNNVIDIKDKFNNNNNNNNSINHFINNQSSGNLSTIGSSGEVFGELRSRRSDSFTSNGDSSEFDWKSMYLMLSQQYQLEKKRGDELEIQVKDLVHENQLLTGRIKVLESHVEVEKKKLHQAFGTIRTGSKKLTMKLGKGNIDLSTILDELGRDIDTISDSTAIDHRLTENAQSMLNKLNSFTPHNSATELLTPEEVAQQKSQTTTVAPLVSHHNHNTATTTTAAVVSGEDTTQHHQQSFATIIPVESTTPTPTATPISTPSSTPLSISASNSLENIIATTTSSSTTEQETDVIDVERHSTNYKEADGQVVTISYGGEQLRKVVKVQSYVRRWYAQQQYKKLKQFQLVETKRLAVGELFETESTYITHLSNLLKIFVAPLRVRLQNGENLVSAHDIERIFSTASTIFKSNSIFLHQMEDMYKNFNRWSQIGGRMLEQLPLFESYIDHPDYIPLTRALDAFKKFADGINERKGMRIKALALEDKILGYKDDITSKSRYLIREGPLRYKKNNEYVFLFNDMLMICHPQYKKSKVRLGVSSSPSSSSNSLTSKDGSNKDGSNKDGSTSPSLMLPSSVNGGSTSPTPSSPTQDHHHHPHHDMPCSYKFITRVMLDARVKIVQDSHEPKFLTIIPDQYSIELTASSTEERHLWVKDLITLVTIFTNNLLNNPTTSANIIPSNNLSSSSRDNSLN